MSDASDPSPGYAEAGRSSGSAVPAADEAGDAPVLADESATYSLRVNGRERPVKAAWLGESLLYVLRERLGLPGSKNACEQGECGSCSVFVDRTLVASCCVLAADTVDADVEGLAGGATGSDVQRSFVEQGAVQCGFCTPGLVVAVTDLLDRRPDAGDMEVREALSGNLCRCTGYGRIFAAVEAVKRSRAEVGS
jgi:carbon-monoxide dehydrogenase small subunit